MCGINVLIGTAWGMSMLSGLARQFTVAPEVWLASQTFANWFHGAQLEYEYDPLGPNDLMVMQDYHPPVNPGGCSGSWQHLVGNNSDLWAGWNVGAPFKLPLWIRVICIDLNMLYLLVC